MTGERAKRTTAGTNASVYVRVPTISKKGRITVELGIEKVVMEGNESTMID